MCAQQQYKPVDLKRIGVHQLE